MKYKRFDNIIAVKLFPQEEIVKSIREIAQKENIKFAKIEGIGRIEKPKISYFDNDLKSYQPLKFNDAYEMTSLIGNIAGNYSVHAHVTISEDKTGKVFGGHLVDAKISIIGEIIITIISEEEVQKKIVDSFPFPNWAI